MKCPYCNNADTRVIDSRPADDGGSIRRRRQCDECGKRFTTYEKVETIPLVVIKKDNADKFASLESLTGIKICAESGSAGETYGNSFEGTTVKGFIKQTECLTEVLSGTADFAVVDAQLAKSYVGKGDYAESNCI